MILQLLFEMDFSSSEFKVARLFDQQEISSYLVMSESLKQF